MNKQRQALLLALDALEDYQANGAPFFKCDPAVAAIRDALAQPEQKPLRRGDRLKCMESGEYAMVWATSRSGSVYIQWATSGFGAYTEEQIGEHFWIVPEIEQEPVAWLSQGGDVSRSITYFDEMGFVDSIPLYTSPAAFTPLADEAIHQLFKHLPSENRDGWVVAFARAIERAHGIGEP